MRISAAPDPFSSDRIMDATARLLSPVRARTEGPCPGASGARRGRNTGGKKSSSAQSVSPAPRPGRKGLRPGARTQGARTAAAVIAAARPLPMKSGAVKDSTEQPSLMKPYYIEHD